MQVARDRDRITVTGLLAIRDDEHDLLAFLCLGRQRLSGSLDGLSERRPVGRLNGIKRFGEGSSRIRPDRHEGLDTRAGCRPAALVVAALMAEDHKADLGIFRQGFREACHRIGGCLHLDLATGEARHRAGGIERDHRAQPTGSLSPRAMVAVRDLGWLPSLPIPFAIAAWPERSGGNSCAPTAGPAMFLMGKS